MLIAYSVAQIMGYFDVTGSLMIFDRHADLKDKSGNRHFQFRGYYVDKVQKNTKKIKEFVRDQQQDDIANDQFSLFGTVDPFTRERIIINKSPLWGNWE